MLVLCGAAFAGLSPVVLGGVDEWTTTTVVPPGWTLEVDRLGNLVMTRS